MSAVKGCGKTAKGCGVVVAVAGLSLAIAPPTIADPAVCQSGGFGYYGSGGRCDGPPDADGSFMRCDTARVFGFGGENCYRVYP